MSNSSADFRVQEEEKEEGAKHKQEQEQEQEQQNPGPGPDSAPTPLALAHHPHIFPEGGTRAWLTVAGAAAFLFVSFGWVNSIGIFQQYYQENLLSEYTPSQIAWIPSLMRMLSPFPSPSP
jgi:hypothetical protein